MIHFIKSVLFTAMIVAPIRNVLIIAIIIAL